MVSFGHDLEIYSYAKKKEAAVIFQNVKLYEKNFFLIKLSSSLT